MVFIKLNHKGRKFKFYAEKVGFFGRIRGLMFRFKRDCPALIFKFDKMSSSSIHSYFVFFPFIAVWLDDKNRIIEIRRISPFSFSVKPRKKFKQLIEIPVNQRYFHMGALLVGN